MCGYRKDLTHLRPVLLFKDSSAFVKSKLLVPIWELGSRRPLTPAAERGVSGHVRAATLIQFKKNETCRAACPDFIAPMMNHYFQVPLERWKYETFGGGTEGVLKEVRAPNGSLADDDSLRIQQIDQISDAEA